MFAASCSSGPDVLKYASGDDAVIITGSVADVLENAGAKVSGDVITLTPQIKRLFDTDLERVSFGIDLNKCIVTANFEADCVLMGAALKSKSTFEKAVSTREGIWRTRTERDGMVLYSLGGRRSQHIVVTDDMVFLVTAIGYGKIEPDAAVRQALDRAEASPLASWQRSILEAGNTMNMLLNVKSISSLRGSMVPALGYDPAEVADGFVRLTADLKDTELKCTGEIYSASGIVLTNSLLTAKVDPSLLRYLPDEAVAASAFAASPDTDWQKVLSAATAAPGVEILSEYKDTAAALLEKISGTVMLGIAPGALTDLASPQGWGVSVAAQLREGAAAEVVANLYDFCENEGIPVTRTDDGFYAQIPDVGTIRASDNNGVIFLTNLAPADGRGDCRYISRSDFADCTGAMVIRLPKDHLLLSLIGVKTGLELAYKATPEDITLRLRVTDTKTPLLQSLLNLR